MKSMAVQRVDHFGRQLISVFQYTSNVFLMIYLACRATFYDQAQGLRSVFSVVSAQIYFTGWQAVPLISVLALASGSLVIIQASSQLNLLGGGDMIGKLLVMVIVREMSPLLTALIVIARSGTAVASELGSMKVNREVEALEAMGINPLSYIVFPRLAGGIISVVCLSFYFIMIAIVGGYFATSLIHNMRFAFYLDSLARAFEFADVFLFTTKNIFSGAIIFIVCCHQGFSVQQSPHEVPQMTTKAVVNSIIYVVLFNMSVTVLYYLNNLIQLGLL